MNYEYEYEKQQFKNYLGTATYNMLKSYNVIVAGGAITSIFTNKEINDIDIYFRSKQDLSDFLYNEMRSNWVIAHTDKAFLFKHNGKKLQAIYFRYFETANDIFNTFDYTVCMGAYDFKSEEFILHEDFLRHNASKILKFNSNTSYPIVSALRISKYLNKGYYISKPEYLRVMLTIANTHITTYEELKAQMGGMYGENYDNILAPKEGEELDISSIIEKISDLNLDKNYFVFSTNNRIDDWDAFIYEILKEKIKYFDFKGNKYRLINGDIQNFYNFDKMNPEMYNLVGIEDVVKFPLVRYKYVKRCTDDSLRSFYDRNYIWKMGENKAQNNYNGLYAVKASQLDSCSYCNEKDRVLIEVLVESFNDVSNITNILNDTCDYRRLIATRVVPEEEVKQLIENSKQDEKPFNLLG
jgi:hypothetical protein